MPAQIAAIKRKDIIILKERRENQLPPTPPKIKIRPRNPVSAKAPSNPVSSKSTAPVRKPRRKGLIWKIAEIIISDIKELPNRIIHGKKVVKKVKMPESKESWKDWEGEI